MCDGAWGATQNGPAVSLYLTLFGIVASFVSTFWSFGYTRLSRRLRGYLQGELRRVRKSDVIYTLQNGCWINILGMAATLLGLQARRSALTPWHGVWLWSGFECHVKDSLSLCSTECSLSGGRRQWDSWWPRRSRMRLPTHSWQAALGHTTQC